MKTSNEYFYSLDSDKDRIGDTVSIGNDKFLINDNDFQINGKTDFKSGITPLSNAANEMLILEFGEDLTK